MIIRCLYCGRDVSVSISLPAACACGATLTIVVNGDRQRIEDIERALISNNATYTRSGSVFAIAGALNVLTVAG